eukprot:scaffold34168_cov66-Phaeocystis_antarctica.AAC.4
MDRESMDWCAPQQRRRSTASESNPKSALSRVGVRVRVGVGVRVSPETAEQLGEHREHRRCEAGGVEGVELLYKVRVRGRVRMRVW